MHEHTKWSSLFGLQMDFFSIVQHKIHILIKTLQMLKIQTKNFISIEIDEVAAK